MKLILKEERGVAMSKYMDVVDKIFNVTQSFVNQAINGHIVDCEENKHFKFKVPKQITNMFDFVTPNCLNFYVVVTFHEVCNSDITGEPGEGFNKTFADVHLDEEGRLSEGTIHINVVANLNGDVYERTFYNVAIHELNHLYEQWKQVKPGKTMEDTSFYSHDITAHLDDIEDNMYQGMMDSFDGDEFRAASLSSFIRNLLYYLWSDTERSSYQTSAFSELRAMKSKRENFNKDIKRTQGYKIYKYYVDYFDTSWKTWSDKGTKVLINALKKSGIKVKSDPTAFRKYFEKKSKEGLERLLKGLMRSASLYYDMQEDSDNIVKKYESKVKNGSTIVEGVLIHKDDFKLNFDKKFWNIVNFC